MSFDLKINVHKSSISPPPLSTNDQSKKQKISFKPSVDVEAKANRLRKVQQSFERLQFEATKYFDKKTACLKRYQTFLLSLSDESVCLLNDEHERGSILKHFDELILLDQSQIKLLNIKLVEKLSVVLSQTNDLFSKQTNFTEFFENFKNEIKFTEHLAGRKTMARKRFKKAIQIVIINGEWLKNLRSLRNGDNFKKLSIYDNDAQNGLFSTKKTLALFDKDEYKAENCFFTVLTDAHRRILSKEQFSRTDDEVELLENLIVSIPRLSAFPKHIKQYIAQLLHLSVYDKGREIIREGRPAIGFYFIISGACDILSTGLNGLLKIDEVKIGETFGENSFQNNGISFNTVITNQRTEIVMILPGEIDMFIQKLRDIENKEMLDFISNWQPSQYWGWSNREFDLFVQKSTYLRYTQNDLIKTDKSSDSIYFLLNGHVDIIKQIDSKRSNIYKLCTLDKYDYFGFGKALDLLNIKFRAQDYVCLACISYQNFISIESYASFLYSKIKDDFKFISIILNDEIRLAEDKAKWEKFKTKYLDSLKERSKLIKYKRLC